MKRHVQAATVAGTIPASNSAVTYIYWEKILSNFRWHPRNATGESSLRFETIRCLANASSWRTVAGIASDNKIDKQAWPAA